MPVSVTCDSVERNANGSVSVTFAGGTGLNFGSLSEIQQYVAGIDNGPEGEELARKFMLARWLRSDPDLSDNAAIVNRVCTFNLGAPNPVQIG